MQNVVISPISLPFEKSSGAAAKWCSGPSYSWQTRKSRADNKDGGENEWVSEWRKERTVKDCEGVVCWPSQDSHHRLVIWMDGWSRDDDVSALSDVTRLFCFVLRRSTYWLVDAHWFTLWIDLGGNSQEKNCLENCLENHLENCLEIPYTRKMGKMSS